MIVFLFYDIVKEELIRQVTTQNKKIIQIHIKHVKISYVFFLGISYEKYKEEKKNEVITVGSEDVNTPLYRNGAGYKTELEN